jgi:MFS family permease
MAYVWMVLAGILGLALGGIVGFKIGERVSGRRTRFWLSIVAVMVVFTVAAWASARWGAMWATVGVLGGLTGSLTGMKYGASEELKSLVTRPGR